MKQSILFMLLAVCIASSIEGQIRDLNITGAGARAEGMGGAFIGVADDATAIVWNPAGLTQLERPEASAVFRQYFENFKSSNSVDAAFGLSSNSKHFALNFGSMAFPFSLGSLKMVAAVAFQNQIDLYIYEKGSVSQTTNTADQTGGVNTISPALGFRLTPMLSVGATGNIWTGSSKYREYDPSNNNALVGGYNDDWSGFNLQLGALVDLNGTESHTPLKVGLSFRTPFKMKDKWHNVGVATDNTWKWDVPTMMGIGASYRFGENLTVAADFEIRKFGKSKIDEGGGITGDLTDHKKDLQQIRLGIEYLIVASAGVFPVRAGFKNVPTLYSNYIWNGDALGQNGTYDPHTVARGIGFTFGTGYIHERFAVDVAYSHSSFQSKYDAASTPYGVYKYDRAKDIIIMSTIFYF